MSIPEHCYGKKCKHYMNKDGSYNCGGNSLYCVSQYKAIQSIPKEEDEKIFKTIIRRK